MRPSLLAVLALVVCPLARAAPPEAPPPTQRAAGAVGPGPQVRAPRPLWTALTGERRTLAHALITECTARFPSPCGVVAVRYFEGREVPRDALVAAALFEAACHPNGAPTRPSQLACASLGNLLVSGEGIPRDLTWARELFDGACRNEVAVACTSLGNLLLPPAPAPEEDARAAALFRRGCDSKDLTGCNNLAWMLEQGRGVARDLAQADALYGRACAGGVSLACKNLGLRHAASTEPARLAEAARLLEPFCGEREPATCSLLGSVQDRRGERAWALAAYARGCDLGHARSCNNLGWLLDVGPREERDTVRVRALYLRACKGGVATACRNAAALAQAAGAPAPEAAALTARACALGDTDACAEHTP